MISEIFTINVTSIGRGAIAAASKQFPLDNPVTINLASHATNGDGDGYIEVRGPGGSSHDIHVSKVEVDSILRIVTPGKCRSACSDFIDVLAERTRGAVIDTQAHVVRFDDSHLDDRGGPYRVIQFSPIDRARAFVMRPGMFNGTPVTFDRACAYIHGFEEALSMTSGRRPHLPEFGDLLKEIRPVWGDRIPRYTQELDAIGALEPILAQMYAAAETHSASTTPDQSV